MTNNEFETRLAQITPRLLRDVRGEIVQQMQTEHTTQETAAEIIIDLMPVTTPLWLRDYQELRPYLTVGVFGFLLGLAVMYWVMTGFFNQTHFGPEKLMVQNDTSSSTYMLILDDKTLDSMQRPSDLMGLQQWVKKPIVNETHFTQYELMKKLQKQERREP